MLALWYQSNLLAVFPWKTDPNSFEPSLFIRILVFDRPWDHLYLWPSFIEGQIEWVVVQATTRGWSVVYPILPQILVISFVLIENKWVDVIVLYIWFELSLFTVLLTTLSNKTSNSVSSHFFYWTLYPTLDIRLLHLRAPQLRWLLLCCRKMRWCSVLNSRCLSLFFIAFWEFNIFLPQLYNLSFNMLH